MTRDTSHQPTLWRTCRVLANSTRLNIFNLVRQHPGLTVSAVAGRLILPLPVTSQYLRAMEARGLLVARREGRWVRYRCAFPAPGEPLGKLVAALQGVFRQQTNPIETIYRATTAFCHPRRIEIYRALKAKACSLAQLQEITGISSAALCRHLGKLQSRGFVSHSDNSYAILPRPDDLGRELAKRVSEE